MKTGSSPIFIIAEAGVNHNGSLERALELVDSAAESGVDAVKFQTFTAEGLACRNAKKAAYQEKTTDDRQSQYDMLAALELDEEAHKTLIAHCKKRRITFLSSPFDLVSIDLLGRLGLELFKIPSGEITNLPYLRKIGSLGKRVILSTGMSDIREVEAALDVLVQAGTSRDDIIVLHCNTQYPTPMADVNLKAMLSMARVLQVSVGYSDHTVGIEVPVAAAALGAVVLEKHFTLDRSLPGPDHKASLEPDELAAMVTAVRNIELALGDGVKCPSASEMGNREVARKSLVAARDIQKGELLSEENLTVKRPATGLSPMFWDRVIGKKAGRNYRVDEQIEEIWLD